MQGCGRIRLTERIANRGIGELSEAGLRVLRLGPRGYIGGLVFQGILTIG